MVILCIADAMRESSHLPMYADQNRHPSGRSRGEDGTWEPEHVAHSLADGFVAAARFLNPLLAGRGDGRVVDVRGGQ
jgi:hypothetical protein